MILRVKRRTDENFVKQDCHLPNGFPTPCVFPVVVLLDIREEESVPWSGDRECDLHMVVDKVEPFLQHKFQTVNISKEIVTYVTIMLTWKYLTASCELPHHQCKGVHVHPLESLNVC